MLLWNHGRTQLATAQAFRQSVGNRLPHGKEVRMTNCQPPELQLTALGSNHGWGLFGRAWLAREKYKRIIYIRVTIYMWTSGIETCPRCIFHYLSIIVPLRSKTSGAGPILLCYSRVRNWNTYSNIALDRQYGDATVLPIPPCRKHGRAG
jgi:hypothetical protein